MKCSEAWNLQSMNYRDKFTTFFRTLPQNVLRECVCLNIMFHDFFALCFPVTH